MGLAAPTKLGRLGNPVAKDPMMNGFLHTFLTNVPSDVKSSDLFRPGIDIGPPAQGVTGKSKQGLALQNVLLTYIYFAGEAQDSFPSTFASVRPLEPGEAA